MAQTLIIGKLDEVGMADVERIAAVRRGERPIPSPEELRKNALAVSDMTGEQFDALMARLEERQKDVPQEGTEAPDFEIDILDRQRKRSGETLRLSSLRGKPVGLIFGSWT